MPGIPYITGDPTGNTGVGFWYKITAYPLVTTSLIDWYTPALGFQRLSLTAAGQMTAEVNLIGLLGSVTTIDVIPLNQWLWIETYISTTSSTPKNATIRLNITPNSLPTALYSAPLGTSGPQQPTALDMSFGVGTPLSNPAYTYAPNSNAMLFAKMTIKIGRNQPILSDPTPGNLSYLFFSGQQPLGTASQLTDFSGLTVAPLLAPIVEANAVGTGIFTAGDWQFAYSCITASGQTTISPTVSVTLVDTQSVSFYPVPLPPGTRSINLFVSGSAGGPLSTYAGTTSGTGIRLVLGPGSSSAIPTYNTARIEYDLTPVSGVTIYADSPYTPPTVSTSQSWSGGALAHTGISSTILLQYVYVGALYSINKSSAQFQPFNILTESFGPTIWVDAPSDLIYCEIHRMCVANNQIWMLWKTPDDTETLVSYTLCAYDYEFNLNAIYSIAPFGIFSTYYISVLIDVPALGGMIFNMTGPDTVNPIPSYVFKVSYSGVVTPLFTFPAGVNPDKVMLYAGRTLWWVDADIFATDLSGHALPGVARITPNGRDNPAGDEYTDYDVAIFQGKLWELTYFCTEIQVTGSIAYYSDGVSRFRRYDPATGLLIDSNTVTEFGHTSLSDAFASLYPTKDYLINVVENGVRLISPAMSFSGTLKNRLGEPSWPYTRPNYADSAFKSTSAAIVASIPSSLLSDASWFKNKDQFQPLENRSMTGNGLVVGGFRFPIDKTLHTAPTIGMFLYLTRLPDTSTTLWENAGSGGCHCKLHIVGDIISYEGSASNGSTVFMELTPNTGTIKINTLYYISVALRVTSNSATADAKIWTAGDKVLISATTPWSDSGPDSSMGTDGLGNPTEITGQFGWGQTIVPNIILNPDDFNSTLGWMSKLRVYTASSHLLPPKSDNGEIFAGYYALYLCQLPVGKVNILYDDSAYANDMHISDGNVQNGSMVILPVGPYG